MKKTKAFTLSEVLITLVVIGIISAITISVIISNHKRQEYKSGLQKAQSVLNNAAEAYYLEYGERPQCWYWKKNPYNYSRICVEQREDGGCAKYAQPNGEPLPNDFNGNFVDCMQLWKSFYKSMNVQKICERDAFANGCIPDYRGSDRTGVLGLSFKKSDIDKTAAIVLTDGMIFFGQSYAQPARIIGVDVNGFKSPNKWGHDVYAFSPVEVDGIFASYCPKNSSHLVENGGKTASDLLYGNE